MVSSISSITSAISPISTAASSSTKLSDETKKKLESLGVDTTNIKTETEGLALLSQIQAAQQAQQAQQSQQPQGADSSMAQMENIKAQISSLASKVGVALSPNGNVDDNMTAISNAISAMKVQSTNNIDKVSKADEYQAQYDAISSSLAVLESQKSSSQEQITGSMSALANYNKIFFNLV